MWPSLLIDCGLLFSSTPIAEAEESKDAEMRRMESTLLQCTKRVTDEYNKAHRTLVANFLTNYRRRIFRAHDLKNVRAFAFVVRGNAGGPPY